jgi:integrase
MKMTFRFVDECAPGYFRFRRGAVKVMLPGLPGTREFQDAYEDAISQNAPELRKRIRGRGALKGTLDWAIVEFKKSNKWSGLAVSTQEIYQRRFDWLSSNYGGEMLASFDRRIIKRIRNLPEFTDKTSVADAIVDRLGALWNYADNNLDIDLPGMNPTLGISSLHQGGEAAPAWTPDLCAAFEAQEHARMVTFYMLARYTGQRRGDCCAMKWSAFDEAGKRIHVVQEKTGTKLWVPLHERLRKYLATLPRESDYILTSPKGGRYAKTAVTSIVIQIAGSLGFKGYSPHGLRHLAGGALAEAGCSVPQIMAVLGHLTMKQAMHYVAQANRTKLADDGMGMLERADAIADAENVVALHAGAKKRTRSERNCQKQLPKVGSSN